jgi:hypothetical protein
LLKAILEGSSSQQKSYDTSISKCLKANIKNINGNKFHNMLHSVPIMGF